MHNSLHSFSGSMSLYFDPPCASFSATLINHAVCLSVRPKGLSFVVGQSHARAAALPAAAAMHGPRHARRTRARGLHSVHAGILHIVVLGRKFSSDAIDFQPGSKGWISTISNLSKLIKNSVGKERTSFATHLDHISTLNLPRCFYSKCCQCGRLLKWHSCIHYTVGGSAFPLRSSLSVFPFPSCRPTLRASVAAFQASLVHRAFARSGGAATAKGPMCNLFTLQIHSHHKQRSHRARRCVEELSRCSYNITISHLKGQSMYRQKKHQQKTIQFTI